MYWFWRSVRVMAGVTVTLSPVWMPMGSMFSMQQMITALSARSRITSYSNSFQPSMDCSISTCPTGLASRPRRTTAWNSSALRAMPAPLPPRVKLGRTIAGSPMRSSTRRASSGEPARALSGTSSPISSMACLNSSRCSAWRMTCTLAPIAFHPEALQHPEAVQLRRQVQGRLAAQGGQQGVGALAGDDLAQGVGIQRLDVGAVRQVRIGHDRGRVGVDQDERVALLAQGLQRLRARVVELAGLADHDGTGADDQDLLQILAPRHGAWPPAPAPGSRRTGRGCRAARGRPPGGTARPAPAGCGDAGPRWSGRSG